MKDFRIDSPDLISAVHALRPNVEKNRICFAINGDATISHWEDSETDPPTKEEILNELQKQIDLHIKFKHYRQRKENLPNTYDLLWILYQDIKNGNLEHGSFVSLLDDIVEKYPEVE